MWENSRIIHNRFFHPFLWPAYIIGGIILLYFVSLSVLYYMYQKEKKDPSSDLYEKALESRRQELINIKLTGAEPYVWKPLFKCESLHQKKVTSVSDKDCIITSLSFLEDKTGGNIAGKPGDKNIVRTGNARADQKTGAKGEMKGTAKVEKSRDKNISQNAAKAVNAKGDQNGDPKNYAKTDGKNIINENPDEKNTGVQLSQKMNQYIYGDNHMVKYLEESPAPCLICHQKQASAAVLWTFRYDVQKPSAAITRIWESADFFYLNVFLWSLIILYYCIKFILSFSRGNDLIAVAVKSGNEEIFRQILSNEWKVQRRMFVYIEITGNNICGYIPRRYLIRLYKKYFTGEFNFSHLDLRIGVVEYNSVSFEGLRIAQAIASRAVSSSVIVQDKILSASTLPDTKRAVLKRKDSELYFNVMDL